MTENLWGWTKVSSPHGKLMHAVPDRSVDCLCSAVIWRTALTSFDWFWDCGSLPGPCLRRDLLNWMLATSCQQGHVDVVRVLVHSYNADVKDCAIHSNEFAIITGLPLYAAARAGREPLVHSRQRHFTPPNYKYLTAQVPVTQRPVAKIVQHQRPYRQCK